MPQLKRAFVALQDRFVSSLAVACCPTMDLVAVITLDRHLLVHRTTSWQKLLHTKPSDVGFEMATLAWRPDGLQLAVGCDKGDVAIFDIESCEVVPDRRHTFRHESAITAMHWAEIIDSEGNCTTGTLNQQVGEDWVVKGPNSQSKRLFRRRASRFLAGYREQLKGDDTVLITADTGGYIALWWMGRVLLTHFDVQKYFSEQQSRILHTLGQRNGVASGFRIERVDIAPDLSLLFVLLAFYGENKMSDDTTREENEADKKVHHMLTLDMTGIQRMRDDVILVADTVDRVNTIVSSIAVTGKQMITEWKNATRIFELKMGLIGSLYEKYACEDPPQVDMLSVVVSGVTAPALAQYFAQDIQEMSIHRMQKALFSGCNALEKLVDEKMKRDLVDLLFLLSELRGHANWNHTGYATTLGMTVDDLDGLVKVAHDTVVATEAFALAIHETRQDFVLFFQWLLERIRVHTSSERPGGDSSAGNNSRKAAADGLRSLLNLRRLCDFLQNAAVAAQSFRKQQQSHSKYKVETTFGNAVSRQLITRSIVENEHVEISRASCISLSESIQKQWVAMQDSMVTAFANILKQETNSCFTVGLSNCSDIVQECHVCFRREFNERGSKYSVEEEEEEEEEEKDTEDEEETVEWSSFKHFGLTRDSHDDRGTILMGFRMQSGALVLVRASRTVGNPTSNLIWDAAVVNFSQGSIGQSVVLRSFDFYGDAPLDKDEQLALILHRTLDDQTHQEWLYLQSYDCIEFSPLAMPSPISSSDQVVTTPFEALLAQGATHTFRIDRIRGRAVASSPASANLSHSVTSVIAIASRGTLCVTLPSSRLAVFDAEDSEDDDEYDDNNEDEP